MIKIKLVNNKKNNQSDTRKLLNKNNVLSKTFIFFVLIFLTLIIKKVKELPTALENKKLFFILYKLVVLVTCFFFKTVCHKF